jgi:hypothetical protein
MPTIIQLFENAENHGHLIIGDVHVLLIVAVVLAVLTPRREAIAIAAKGG